MHSGIVPRHTYNTTWLPQLRLNLLHCSPTTGFAPRSRAFPPRELNPCASNCWRATSASAKAASTGIFRLAKMLDRWEGDETAWLDDTVVTPRAAARWARFVEHCADLSSARREAALRAWARRDERVAARISGIEKKRSAHVSSVLRDIGFAPEAAE